MSEEFKPIQTQAEFDAAIRERINRQNEKHSKEIADITAKYTDYESLKAESEAFKSQIEALNVQLNAANEKANGFDSAIAQKDKEIEGYKMQIAKQNIANEFNLSNDAMDFLTGTNEEEMRANAEKLVKITASSIIAPLASNAPAINTSKDAALKQLANDLFN